jgi:chromosome partitioning protein
MQTISLIRMSTNPILKEEGILLTMFDSKTNLSNQVVEEVRKHFGTLVYDSIIPRAIGQAVTGPWSQAVFEAMSH